MVGPVRHDNGYPATTWQQPDSMTRQVGSAHVRFPPVETADEDGLLLVGGKLTLPWILQAYRRGIFPWPFDEDDLAPVAWWSPDPRAVMEYDGFHISRRLRDTIRSGRYHVRINADFAGVMDGCAAPRELGDGTWITPSMKKTFRQLHNMGLAHSVETWHDGQLVGGVYGLALGSYFSAESMFYRRRDASKVALVALMERLRERGFTLVDIQQWTPHTGRMGATEIPRRQFLRRLRSALKSQATFA